MSENRISAVIITLNEEKRIKECLESLDFVDEIIVVDSGSSDNTVNICLKMGARVVSQEWLGFGAQKQFATEQSVNDWVLCLDADERISPELKSSILDAINNSKYSVYKMPRRNIFLGRWLAHGEGYPDYNIRLFKKDSAKWSNDPVHEHVVTNNETGTLKGDLLHNSEDGIADYLNKQNRYTSLQAELLFTSGKKIGAAKMVISPLVRFIKFYFFKRGFLDGIPGLIHVVIGCVNSFTKYAKTIELQRQQDNDK
ncbi:MAG: glycosyltransferase family 2 protein [Gammaproteobacteria bacterium]|nr:MAG: glycosyltransferase family 2 protein [Gammaproteobacteria bacterium]